MSQTKLKSFIAKPVEELQKIYDSCIERNVQRLNEVRLNKSGSATKRPRAENTVAYILVEENDLWTSRDPWSALRRSLFNAGVKLHSSDQYLIERLQWYWSNEEARKSRKNKMSVTNKAIASSRPEEVQLAKNKKHSAFMLDYMQNVPVEERELRHQKQIDYWKVPAHREAQRDQQLAFYAKMSRDELREHIRKILDGMNASESNYTSKHFSLEMRPGHFVKFQSSWEYPVYMLFQRLGIPFQFANELPGNWLDLNNEFKMFWNPDYIIHCKDIVEVKGRPEARDKFYQFDLPGFLLSKYSKEYNLYLLEYKIDEVDFSSYEELIQACTLIHHI